MRAWVAAAAVCLVVGGVGCANQSKAKARAGEPSDPGEVATGGSGQAGQNRYVDSELGFTVSRPNAQWQMDVGGELTPDGIATPVVMRNAETGAQVVIQVAPAVASPIQFAERLTEGMRSHPGFETSDPEPIPLSSESVGFRFSMGDRVLGRVAVREGAEGRVLMMLATWPAGSPEGTWMGVEEVFRTIQPVQAQ